MLIEKKYAIAKKIRDLVITLRLVAGTLVILFRVVPIVPWIFKYKINFAIVYVHK